MTVSTEISSNEYTGNGVTTDFDYKFRIFKANQLSVITSDANGDNVVTLRLGTDYTVTGANKSAGGKVILTKPLANGHKISIARDIPIKQETSFRNQSKFLAETHEDAFDYLTMIIQRIWGSLGSLYLKRPNILANWFDAKGYRIANLGKPKRDSDAVDLGTLKDEISGVNSTILKKEKRTLRVDDMDITALPKASERAGNVLTFDKDGKPIVVAPATGSAVDVITQLSKVDGISLIGSDNYDGVRNYSGSNKKIIVYGIQSRVDGGAGVFVLDEDDDISVDNGGTILIDALNRRWKRQYNGLVDAKWFGIKYDGTDKVFELCSFLKYCSETGETGYISGWVGVSQGVTLPDNLSLVGVGKNKSGIKYIGLGGENTFVAKNSKYKIGEPPQASQRWNKLVSLSNIGFDANNIADFGLYTVCALFFDYRSVWSLRAKKVSNFFGWAFSSYASDISCSDSHDIGLSIGYDYFVWGGSQKAECNAVLFDKVICYGNGKSKTYNKLDNLNGGAGAIVGRTIGCSINLIQCEQNNGIGLIVEEECKTSFNTVYLESNANDGTDNYYQIYNKSIDAEFNNIVPQFNSKDVFYASVRTIINGWKGQRIIGSGYVTLEGGFRNATVQTLSKCDIKLSESTSYPTNTAPVKRVNMIQMAPDSTKRFFRTKVYSVGFFISLKESVSINSGLVIKLMDVFGNNINDYPVPAGSYNNGDVIEIIIDEDLSIYKCISWRIGGSLQDIKNPDIGLFARIIV